jgi:hypothetical protein
MSAPVFVVVGHPNKGKSSIVSTLAHDDSVRVAPDPGTTIAARAFPMRVDGEILYSLVDTPGFQRARAALQWMQEHETTAAEHAAVVRAFVREHRGGTLFHDECELLAPIVEGGGVLYVVDGSKPYGPEYEPEMEILRWTGRPSMALVNPIGGDAHVRTWEDALSQYFRIVRVLDAHQAVFDQQLDLLRAFGQMHRDWRAPMDRAVGVLARDRERRVRRAAERIAELLADMLTLSVARNIGADAAVEEHKAELEARVQDQLRALEQKARRDVEALYDHHDLQRVEDVSALRQDLFSAEVWHLFGRSKWRLAVIGASGGAITGGVLDASIGGLAFGVLTGLGAAAGAALGWQAAEWSSSFQVFNLPGMEKVGLSGRRLQCGPTRNPNLPFVALGRARHHHRLVASRAHARRDPLVVDTEEAGALNPLEAAEERAFHASFTRLRKAGAMTDAALRERDALADRVHALLQRDGA